MNKNETAVFLSDEYSWHNASLELVDVQPLHGGVRVFLPGWTSAELFVTRFAGDGSETKFRIRLDWTAKKKAELMRLCIEQDFCTIQPEDRLGVPDEARPHLTLTNSKQESHTITKWVGVTDARFDTIYQQMLALAARTEGQRPIPKRFNTWQKGAVIAAIGLGLLPLPLLGYALARPLVNALWPERFGLLLVLLLHLMAFLLAGMAGLAWWERGKPAWDRAYTHFWTVAGVNLCFFLAGIGAWGLAETAVAIWRSDVQLSTVDERVWYAILGYAAVITAVFLLALAGPLMPRLLDLIDERF